MPAPMQPLWARTGIRSGCEGAVCGYRCGRAGSCHEPGRTAQIQRGRPAGSAVTWVLPLKRWCSPEYQGVVAAFGVPGDPVGGHRGAV